MGTVPNVSMLTLPDITPLNIPPNPYMSEERLNPAKWAYERLAKQIQAFEAALSPKEELGGRFVTAPKEGVIHIEDIGYWGPDMLMFYGKDADGRPVQLLQHHSQLSVLLCAVPKVREEPRRNGFILEQKLKV
jgi:hypothetical protein